MSKLEAEREISKMSVPDAVHCSNGNMNSRINHEIQLILVRIRQIQQSHQLENLESLVPRFGKLQTSMEEYGLDGARMLCQMLSGFSEALFRNSLTTDCSEGLGVLFEGTSKLAAYVSLVSVGFAISPLMMACSITRMQQLSDNDTKTSFDLFQPCDLPLGYAYIPPSTAALDGSLKFDRRFHFNFRTKLLVYLRERQLNSLDDIANLFVRIEPDQEDQVSPLAGLVSSCVEIVQYKTDKFDAAKAIERLFAELDLLIRQICLHESSDESTENLKMLLRKMLFLIGDNVYGGSRANDMNPQDIGPNTQQICKLFRLDLWFAEDPDRVIRGECEKSIALANDLSQLAKRSNYESLMNSLTLFFLDGLEIDKTEEMFARLDQMKRTASMHADGILKVYVIRLCETIFSIDIHSKSFADSRQDTKIASAWMMLWSFVESHGVLTVEKIRCLGQRILDEKLEQGGTENVNYRPSDSLQNNIHATSIEKNDYSNFGLDFMDPWPSRESAQAFDVLKTRICNELSRIKHILVELEKKGIGGSRLAELPSVIRDVECLYTILGDRSAIEVARRVEILVTKAINSSIQVSAFANTFIVIVDCMMETANTISINEHVDQGSDMRFDRVNHLLDEYLANPGIPLLAEIASEFKPIQEQLDLIRIELEQWQEDIANREIAMAIREKFSRLEKLCEVNRNKEIPQICNVIVSMICEENLTSKSDSTVILNLLHEVYQSIEAELNDSSQGTQEHIRSILRMVEKL